MRGKIRVTAVSEAGVGSETIEPGTKNPFKAAQELRAAAAKQGVDPADVDVKIGWDIGLGRRQPEE